MLQNKINAKIFKKVLNFMDHFMALCFIVRSAVHAGKSVYDLSAMDGSYQLQYLFCSQL
jgi:hypothetical protein